ncbi:MAG TPA: PhzF family phenazine biosynthesis protein [Vicinamibacterales bacterium]|nr:PhzF family phenazine biosynthesis protein [Vicinamibacterales bacterium]
MRRFRYVVCDVFTDVPLAGNQLAVFTDARDLDPLTMQSLAREMSLSETVFVLPPSSSDADVRIRIFTPALELPFAGHPTLGAAFVLGGPLQKVVIRLETGAGVVPVELEREGPKIVFGRMDQPIPVWSPVANAGEILAAVGAESSGLPVERYELGPGHVYLELGSPAEVAALKPDLGALAKATNDGTNCFARDGARWKTRMFAPNHGVAEDAATGSAAGPLAVHLARHGRTAFGEQIEISQGAEINRPSTLYAEAHGSGDEIQRVVVGGSAVIVARVEFSLP